MSTSPSTARATTLRSHLAGALRASDVGTEVRLGGWVHRTRDLGGHVFLHLRDREGVVQCSFNADWAPAEVVAAAAAVGVETVVLVDGIVSCLLYTSDAADE